MLALPGIGPYTAGAVCSIAFELPVPAVDGNVMRLAARLLNDPTPVSQPSFRKETEEMLREIYPERAGDFTQALIELGATLCGPNREPECAACPCREICLGYKEGTAASLPLRAAKKARKQEDKTVFIYRCEDRYALEKRPDCGLLAGLWQFPNVPGKLDLPEALEEARRQGMEIHGEFRQIERKHIFTHVEWDMRAYYQETAVQGGNYCWLTAEEIGKEAALPTAFRQFWERKDPE